MSFLWIRIKWTIFLVLFLSLAFIGIMVSSASVTRIEIEGADAVSNETLVSSKNLLIVAEDVEPRIVVKSAEEVSKTILSKSSELVQSSTAVSPRIVVVYAEKIDSIKLESPPFIYTPPPKSPTSLTITAATASITIEQPITISGYISPPLEKITISLTYLKPDGTTLTMTVISSSDGSYTDTFKPDQIGVWRVKSSWDGNVNYLGAESREISFEVTPIPPTTIPKEENHPPVISELSAEQSSITPGETVRITATASDSDQDPLTYNWSSNGGVISGEGSTVTWKAPEEEGIYTIILNVDDGRGGSNEQRIFIEVASEAKQHFKPGEPYVNLYSQKTIVKVGEEIVLQLGVINPITSPSTMKAQLTLSVPPGWSITSGEFSPVGGGLQTATYDVEQGSQPKIIGVRILANQPYQGEIEGFIDYYFNEQPDDRYRLERRLPVQAVQAEAVTLEKLQESSEPENPILSIEQIPIQQIIISIAISVIGGLTVRYIWHRLRKSET